MLGRHAPSRFVVLALALTLALSVLLGVDAVLTARRHRTVAEGVLVDYASFGANELGNRLRAAIGVRLSPVLNAIAAAAGPGGSLPDPEVLAAEVDSTVWRAVADSISLIRVRPSEPRLEVAGPPLPDAAARRLTDSLPGHAAKVFSSSRAYLTLFWLPGERVAVVGPPRGGRPDLVGYVIPTGALSRVLAASLEQWPLLPPSLTRGARADSAALYRVVTPDGRVLVASAGPFGSRFSASRTLAPLWGSLRADVGLREALADRLVIGGLPASRLPVVLALLGLATLLVVTAWIQLGRERELARLREAFVAGVSHELRTPLAQIRLFAETLRLGRVRTESERQRSLEIIDHEARRLGHLVDNLLAVSRAGRGTLRVSPRPVDLAPLLREAVETFAPLAGTRGAVIELSAPAEAPATADADAVRQIALNLLDNAVKYGPDGQTIRVTLASEGGLVRLGVEDQGPGIPADQRDRIFEPFVRLDPADRDLTTGTGLGLALVRDLTVLQGGSCRAESATNGPGARLVVELPGPTNPTTPGPSR
jgi:signal transduction histidine kinase